jgi:hypothetical protein
MLDSSLTELARTLKGRTMNLPAFVSASLLSVSAYAQMTFVSQYREVSSQSESVDEFRCTKTVQSDIQTDRTLTPLTLRSESVGFISHPDPKYNEINFGLAELTTELSPETISFNSFADGIDHLCGCAGSGSSWGEARVDVFFTLGATTRVVIFGNSIYGGGSSIAVASLLDWSTKAYLGGTGAWSWYGRTYVTLSPGTYRFGFFVNGGWRDSGCGSSKGLLTAALSTNCPCIADADLSGGTPDVEDINFFVQQWLAGNMYTDADCSAGTPDTADLETFFAQWLSGGC